ncbi:hypothetical protein ILYODFUR_038733, partial [Ilyodon furcidens]
RFLLCGNHLRRQRVCTRRHPEKRDERWTTVICLLDAFLGRCSRHVPPGGGPGHAGGTMSLGWPGNALGSPRRSWRRCLGRGTSGRLC